ncbi:MAG TPA: hypothetical protein VGK78_02390 [Nocardioides sp.]|uniref:hypothetical protein n=1 Tax=Nocardioides sp. TaxID=35761 RepID=UPI002F418335
MEIDWDSDCGVLLRREALALGYDDHTIYRNLRAGVWHRIRMGAYVDARIWEAQDEIGRHRLTARAVLKAAHSSAVLTHVSSVLEHEAAVFDMDLSEVHITRTDGKAGRREAGVVHHHGDLDVDEVEIVHGLPVSSAGRSAIELTTMTGMESSLVSLNWLLRVEAVTKSDLEALVARFRHWPGSLRSDLVVRLADGRCGWPGEARTGHLLWSQHIPPAEPQHEIRDAKGHLIGTVDFAWPEFGVFLEFDGAIKYERLRKDGETVQDVIRREKRREEQICALTGWVCIRITWDDLARPNTTARRIRALLESRRPVAG